MLSMAEILEIISDKMYSPKFVEIVAKKIILASGAYTALDVVSEATTIALGAKPWLFEGMARKRGGAGIIHDVQILAETTNIASQFSLFLHKGLPTCELGDAVPNTAFIAADVNIAVHRIHLPAADDVGTGMSETFAGPSTVGNLPKLFVCAGDSRDLQGVLAIRNAVDLADKTTLTIKIWVEQL